MNNKTILDSVGEICLAFMAGFFAKGEYDRQESIRGR